jgi:hypothetical protein
VQQFLLSGCEPGAWVAAAFGVEVGVVQVRALHGEQVMVAAGKIRARPAHEDQAQAPPGSGGPPGGGGQVRKALILGRFPAFGCPRTKAYRLGMMRKSR